LQKVVDVMPPRQSTLIRAAALYPRSDIPWTGLPDGSHQISVTGRPFGDSYLYALSGKYIEPEEPDRMGGRFALRPASGVADGKIDCVSGSLGGELLLNSYGGGAIVDSLASILHQTRGDLRSPWDKEPGQFNHHDEIALARFKTDFPALSAK